MAVTVLLVSIFPGIMNVSAGVIVMDDFCVISCGGSIVRDIFGDDTSSADGYIASNGDIFYDTNIWADVGIVYYSEVYGLLLYKT